MKRMSIFCTLIFAFKLGLFFFLTVSSTNESAKVNSVCLSPATAASLSLTTPPPPCCRLVLSERKAWNSAECDLFSELFVFSGGRV